jgi:hypothetical protein
MGPVLKPLAAGVATPHLGDTVDPLSLQRHSFIDDEIFSTMSAAGVQSAPLTTDEEFLRRVTLDLTGRIPVSSDIRAFVADTSPAKRSALIDKLLNSPEFSDKWTMWLGDLMQNNITSINITRNTNARNAFYQFINNAVTSGMSLKDMAYQVVTAGGNTYDSPSAAAFILNGNAPGGPQQDTFDMSLYKTASTFLGLGHYDCLLCHNGRGHLDALSLWGSQTTRTDAEHMAAFFAKTRFSPGVFFPPGTSTADQQANFYYQSTRIEDVNPGTYNLPTTYGNRPNRAMINGTGKTADPMYRTGATPRNNGWRTEFAENMIRDPLLSINLVNRMWKAMFNLGLVDAVDQLDPARLDPANPPPAPWALQATHPALLVKLAQFFDSSNGSLRETLRKIVESSAYQLSARYNGAWTPDQAPLFARHYPRRLDGEEVHDAISQATGVFAKYTVAGWSNTVQWAMQLPDTSEPRSNSTSNNFMNNLLRGNRDTVPRSQNTTIIQSSALMNDSFVMSRFHMTQSPVLQAVAKLTDTTAQLEEMYLTYLGRMPSNYERTQAMAFLSKATTAAQKNAALAWALINKLDFLFSY